MGLYFIGTTPSWSGTWLYFPRVYPVATGGRETIEIFEPGMDAGVRDAGPTDAYAPDGSASDGSLPDATGAGDGSLPDATGAGDGSLPDATEADAGLPDAAAPDAGIPDAGPVGAFAWPYALASDHPEILEVGSPSGADAPVFGVSPGTARMRVLEPDGIHLYDRVGVTVDTPTTLIVHNRFDVPHVNRPDAGSPAQEFVLLAGSHATACASLFGQDGDFLVDEAARLTVPGATSTQLAFDLVGVDVPTSGEVTVEATSGSNTLRATLRVVAAADSVYLVDEFTPTAATGDTTLCFVAYAGSAIVLGDAWTFSPSSAISGVTADERGPWPGCVTVHGTPDTRPLVTVTFGGVTEPGS